MKRYGFLGTLLLVALAIAGCTVSVVSREGDLKGFVYVPENISILATDAEVEPLFTYQPIPPQGYEPAVGVKVKAISESTGVAKTVVTGWDGGFHFRNLTEGYYRVTISEGQLRFGTANSRVYVYRNQENWINGPILGGLGYYLSIGIDTYPNEPKIPGAAENARHFHNAFYKENGLAGYGVLLTNETATKENIRNVILDAADLAERSDYLVIYFSGISGQDFLSPSDDPGDGDWSYAITDVDLEQWTEGFPGSVTLIVDGTQSYTMADGKPLGTQALRGPKYTVISADNGDDGGVFYDRDLNSSVFTYFLLAGVSQPGFPADANGDGDITALELYEYLDVEMRKYFRNDPDWLHLPGFWPGLEGESVIFRY